MQDDRTDLYRMVAQTFLFVEGATNVRYEVLQAHLIQTEDGCHYEIESNHFRTGRLSHPLAHVMSSIHIVLTGTAEEFPEDIVFDDEGIAEIEVEDMSNIFPKVDLGGNCNAALLTKIGLHAGGLETFTRHYTFKNNMLYKIQ